MWFAHEILQKKVRVARKTCFSKMYNRSLIFKRKTTGGRGGTRCPRVDASVWASCSEVVPLGIHATFLPFAVVVICARQDLNTGSAFPVSTSSAGIFWTRPAGGPHPRRGNASTCGKDRNSPWSPINGTWGSVTSLKCRFMVCGTFWQVHPPLCSLPFAVTKPRTRVTPSRKNYVFQIFTQRPM